VTTPLLFLAATLACLVYWAASLLPLPKGEPPPVRPSLLDPLLRHLQQELALAQLHLPTRLLLNAMLTGAALGALIAWPFHSGVLGAVSAASLGLIPYRLVRGRIRRRNQAISAAVQPALVQIAKLSEVRHHPFLALSDALPLLEEPLCSEFGRAVAETQAGLPLPDALRQVATRCGDNFYLHQLAELVAINIKTGGDLSTSLHRLTARMRTMEELKAEETAELFGYKWLTRALFAAALLPLPYWAVTHSESLQVYMEHPLARGILVWVVVSGLAIAALPYLLAIEEG
jgi:hypothetical protein